jgi:hypothetical protein
MAEENQNLENTEAGVSINMSPAPVESEVTPAVSQEAPAQSQTLYSSDNPLNDQVDLEKAGFDLKIQQEKPINELQSEQENVVDSIVKQATVNKFEEEKILNELETLDPTIGSDIPIAPMVQGATRTARNIFIAILVIALLSVGYFYVNQKGFPLFGFQANTRLAEAETQLNDIKTEAVINDLIAASLEYRNVSYLAGVYSIDMQNNGVANRVDLEEAILRLNKKVKDINDQLVGLESVQQSILVDLSDKSRILKESLKIAKNEEEREGINLEIELIAESQKLAKTLVDELATESGLLSSLTAMVENDYQGQEFLNKLDAVFKNYKFNEYAKIAHIQRSRVNWTEVINEIEAVTRSIDPTFSLDGTIDEDGISYSAFAFNRDNSRVNITGQTRTSDIKTFTLIADLTDAFEESDMFSIHDSRTFNKQADEDDGYRAAITLDVILESKES